MKKIKQLFTVGNLIILTELVLLAFFLYWHYRLGLVRYFDQDEFAHLHWGYNFFSGLKPYTGFLYFFPPGFLLFLYPLFMVAGKTTFIFTAARFYAFLVFILLTAALFLLTKAARNTKTALLAVVVFAFLPVPFDKLIEIRPDNLSTAFSLLGMYFLVKGILKETKWSWFFAGLSYGLAIFILTKAIFFLPAVLLVLAVWAVYSNRSLRRVILAFAAGLAVTAFITLFSFVLSGDFLKALYLTTEFAGTSSKILGEKFRIIPNLWFYAVSAYYGEEYPNLYHNLNLIIYLSAILFGILRFVSCLDKKNIKYTLVEILIGVSFLSNLTAYLHIFSLKHSQYIIAFAPFIAFYFADLVTSIFRRIQGKKISLLISLVLLTLLLLMARETERIGKIKITWTNNQTFAYLNKTYSNIPAGSFVLDLYGETLRFRDPYYICCLPYGQYTEAFDFELPALSTALVQTQTKYIYVRDKDRLTVLPAKEQNFIRDNYILAERAPDIFKPGRQLNLEKGEEAESKMIISGNYDIYWNGRKISKDEAVNMITVDDRMKIASPISLTAGKHTIKAGEKGELKLVYAE